MLNIKSTTIFIGISKIIIPNCKIIPKMLSSENGENSLLPLNEKYFLKNVYCSIKVIIKV